MFSLPAIAAEPINIVAIFAKTGIAVKSNFRSQGIGKALLCELIDIAQKNSIKTMSLSVDPNNYACRFYKSAGFIKVGESGTSWTFLLNL